MDSISLDQAWHALERDQVLTELRSAAEGLATDDVFRRQALYGRNVVPEAPPKRLIAVYLHQFKNIFIYLLLIACAVSFALGEIGDGLFIAVALQINAIIGTVQEWRAHQKARALNIFVQTTSIVSRDGKWAHVDSRDLVPGDVVRLEAGMEVPAAIRLLWGQGIEADEALLTGESVPAAKDAEAAVVSNTPLADQANMLHAGTTLLRGRGRGIVTATGRRTEVGRVAEALQHSEDLAPPLIRRMEQFTRIVAAVMIPVIFLIAIVELIQGVPPEIIFLTAVALAVAAIPEGLPVAITVALAISVTRMSRRNVIVRKLAAVESLGACTLVAADKTGTLTQNKLSVRIIHLPRIGDLHTDTDHQADFDSEIAEQTSEELMSLVKAGVLCNEASLRDSGNDDVEVIGDTVDGAFLMLARSKDIDPIDLAEVLPRVSRIPYDAADAFAASFHEGPEGLNAFIKGATEIVLPMCKGVDIHAITNEMERLAQDGHRVLAVASGNVENVEKAALKELNFLGLVGLIDPLRPQAAEAVRRCENAGVAVRMITGDHPLTALAIARDLNLAEGIDDVITGPALADLETDQAAFDAEVARGRIFARVGPMQKLAIIQSMQRAGHTVAVTGDGVNDASALARADVGAAMGRSGTDVARNAADLIVADDDLSSIADGIWEGRIAYDNIRKVIYLLISTGAAEIVLFVAAIGAGLPLPLTAVQLLWLNLVTQGIQDVGLAFEKGEPGVFSRPPRPPKEGIFNRQMIEQTILSGLFVGGAGFVFFWFVNAAGWEPFAASNALLLLLILFENAHVFNCRSETRSAFVVPLKNNPFLVIGVFAAQGIHIIAMYTPGLNSVLDIAPVPIETWLLLAGTALSVIIVMEIYKLLVRH